MKNQYVGDVNDYVKYGLLRLLSGDGELQTAVCWMLTADDGRSDGRFTQYLYQPETWRRFDQTLFDAIARWMARDPKRNVGWVEQSNLLPRTQFFSRLLRDDGARRKIFFRSFLKKASGCDLVFFDPDNGIEVKSRAYGSRGSSKYVYYAELAEAYRRGHSLLVFQYFPRVNHSRFIDILARRLRTRVRGESVISIASPRVVYMLLPQPIHLEAINRSCRQISRLWAPVLTVRFHHS